MIEWKDLKFACLKCTKGHRTANCTHFDTQLEVIKSKGRPVSQCKTCQEKRKQGYQHPHHKCVCGQPVDLKRVLELWFPNGLVISLDKLVDEAKHLIDSNSEFEFKISSKQQVVRIEKLLPIRWNLSEEPIEIKPGILL